MVPPQQTPLSAQEMADLARLADGTLEASRRPEVEARIAGSPELRALYERERRVVAALHAARADDRAPARLRARIEAQRPSRRGAVRRRASYAGALAGALAIAAVVLALVLPAGTPGAPSVSQAAALAARGPVDAAPASDPARPRTRLDQAVGEVYFPNWTDTLGWRAVGQRTDRLGGRRAVTVYYERAGRRIAYTIVGAPALAEPATPTLSAGGVPLRSLRLGARAGVTWRRDGHTCVVSGAGVTMATLAQLAAWSGPRSASA